MVHNISFTEIDPSTEPEKFWLTMGPVFASRSIRKEFDGYPLSNDDGWKWILAEHNGSLVGFISLEPLKHSEHISSMWVSKDFRKKGVCSELLKRALDIADWEKKSVSITTRPFMQHVMEKLGFEKTGEKKNWMNFRRGRA